jgi:hypothetical protein
MRHLSPAELVDAADGTLPPARAAHVEGCGECRGRLSAVRSALNAAAAGESDVPDPSPLYWEQLTAHVRERVDRETIVPAWRTAWRDYFDVRGLVPIASAVALVAAVVGAGMLTRRAPVPGETAATVASQDAALPDDLADLAAAASAVPIDEAHAAGLGVPAEAVDDAVQRLSSDELNELNRLLERELAGRGNRGN